MTTIDPRVILATPMQDNDADAETVGAYLVALARQVWQIGEGFSGKRPFGNSGWESEVYIALAAAGHIESTVDKYGEREIDSEQENIANGLIEEALDALLERPDAPTGEESGELVYEVHEGAATVLTPGQQIRLAIVDKMLDGDGAFEAFKGEDDPAEFGRIMVQLVAPVAAFVETGAEPVPPLAVPGAADGAATGDGGA